LREKERGESFVSSLHEGRGAADTLWPGGEEGKEGGGGGWGEFRVLTTQELEREREGLCEFGKGEILTGGGGWRGEIKGDLDNFRHPETVRISLSLTLLLSFLCVLVFLCVSVRKREGVRRETAIFIKGWESCGEGGRGKRVADMDKNLI
jgi:hypothetical protein